jgi:hypothetical protein
MINQNKSLLTSTDSTEKRALDLEWEISLLHFDYLLKSSKHDLPLIRKMSHRMSARLEQINKDS